jgi:hypothetical protein
MFFGRPRGAACLCGGGEPPGGGSVFRIPAPGVSTSVDISWIPVRESRSNLLEIKVSIRIDSARGFDSIISVFLVKNIKV